MGKRKRSGTRRKVVPQPRVVGPLGRKQPSAAFDPDLEDAKHELSHPLYSFEYLDWDGPFGWSACAPDRVQEILKQLGHLESMTWRELLADNYRYHYMPTEKLEKPARDRLTMIDRDDETQLFSIRLGNQPRVWSIRRDGVLKILWWDPDHQVYATHIRNT